MRLLDDDHVYLPTGDGHFVSEKQRRTAEILKDFYPHLELQYIPPEHRGYQDYEFRVVDATPGRAPYVVCFSHTCDERLLTRVIMADNKNGDRLNVLEAHNTAIELYEAKKRQEERYEMHEIMHSALNHQKYNWMHNGINFGVRR